MHQQPVLRIYRAPSGQWAGRLFEDCEEVGAIGRCASPQEVEKAAWEQGFYPEHVEVIASGAPAHTGNSVAPVYFGH